MTVARRCRTGGPGATPGMRFAISALRRFRRFPCGIRPFVAPASPVGGLGRLERPDAVRQRAHPVRQPHPPYVGLFGAVPEAIAALGPPRSKPVRPLPDGPGHASISIERPDGMVIGRGLPTGGSSGKSVRTAIRCGKTVAEPEAELGRRVSRHGKPHPTVRLKALWAIGIPPPAGTRYNIPAGPAR